MSTAFLTALPLFHERLFKLPIFQNIRSIVSFVRFNFIIFNRLNKLPIVIKLHGNFALRAEVGVDELKLAFTESSKRDSKRDDSPRRDPIPSSGSGSSSGKTSWALKMSINCLIFAFVVSAFIFILFELTRSTLNSCSARSMISDNFSTKSLKFGRGEGKVVFNESWNASAQLFVRNTSCCEIGSTPNPSSHVS